MNDIRKYKSRSVRDRKASPHERVRRAYERGITDRIAIKKLTRLPLEEVCEAISELSDRGVIVFDHNLQTFRVRMR